MCTVFHLTCLGDLALPRLLRLSPTSSLSLTLIPFFLPAEPLQISDATGEARINRIMRPKGSNTKCCGYKTPAMNPITPKCARNCMAMPF